MKTLLFTDTHFGVKQNSVTWLNYQTSFIKKQIIPYIQQLKNNKEIVRVIHLGDVFDSRSTISTLVATQIVGLFKTISDLADEFYIIGGNHDYYSPASDSVDTLNLLFGTLPIKIITKDALVLEDNLIVPWYSWFETDKLNKIIKDKYIKRVFTHADIITSPVQLKGVDIFSGHTHIPYIKGHIKNLGSCYALNFADANQPRGFYILDEEGKLFFEENTESIKFWRIYNEEIFEAHSIKPDDYIELYINQGNMYNEKYINKINEYTKHYKNIWTIPQVTTLNESVDDKFEGYDIETITANLIPEELKQKFQFILKKLQDNEFTR